MRIEEARRELETLLGKRNVLSSPEDLTLYEYDGSVDKARPDLVVFPRTTEDVAGIVKITRRHGIPILGRGAGTGLSGGSIPLSGGVVIGFSRMNKILEIDLENERAIVQPGVVNLDITAAVQADGYFYAPDPSSQKACTIGGNVAENAAGPHTLAYGVTSNHVLGLELVLMDGSVVQTGGLATDQTGYDLTGFMIGTEGTMALVTKVMVRLMKKPEAVKTMLAIYDSAEDCGQTVSEITASGITPVALEMMDGVMLRIVEEATQAGYPMDAAAVLLIEVEGLEEDCRRADREDSGHLQGEPRPGSPPGPLKCRARTPVEGAQERLWRHRTGEPDFPGPGRHGAAHEDSGNHTLHSGCFREVRRNHQ